MEPKPKPPITDVQIAMSIAVIVGELIQELGQIPSGELYAILMGKFSLETYESLIGLLIRSNLIRQENSHLLVWIGPKKGSK